MDNKTLRAILKKLTIALIFVSLISLGRGLGTLLILWFLLLFVMFAPIYSNKKILEIYSLSILLAYFVFLGFSNYILLYQHPSNDYVHIKEALNWLLFVAGFSYIAGLIIPTLLSVENKTTGGYIRISSTLLVTGGLLMIIGVGLQGFYLFKLFSHNLFLFQIGVTVTTFAEFLILVAICDVFLRSVSILVLMLRD